MKKYYLIGPIALFFLWLIVAKLQLVDKFFLPDPIQTIKELAILLGTGVIWPDLLLTLERVSIAFVIAVAIGLPLGLILGCSEKLYRSSEFVIDFFRSTPATAMVPLFLLIFGISDISKIAVTAFASALIIIFNTAHGIMNAKKSRLLAAKIMGATQMQVFRKIMFWESLPQIFIGLRSAISLSLIIVIITEMFIGSTAGLGKRIIDSQITYEITALYATILLAGIVGYILNFILLATEKHYLHWGEK